MRFLISVLFLIASPAFAYQVYFSPMDALDEVVVEQIEKAEKSLDIAIYTFNSDPVREAILNKLKSDSQFKVRILAWKSNRKSTAAFMEPIRELINQNKSEKYELIRYVTVTNHHKYMIVDGKTLVNTSGNFNASKLAASYDENLLVCSEKCKKIITAFQNEFDYLFTNSNALALDVKDGELLTPLARPKKMSQAIFTSFNFNIKKKGQKFSMRVAKPDKLGEVESKLIKVIDKAKTSIKIATGHFRTWTLLKSLVAAKKRGVKVEMVLDSQEYISAASQRFEDRKKKACLKEGKTLEQCYKTGYHFGRLAHKAGLDVYVKYYMLSWDFIFAPQMHHKYMIVDGKALYSGSYNWSKNAEFKTLENIAVIRDKELIASYEENYERLKNYGENKYDKLVAKWSRTKKGKKLYARFKAMSLSFDEIDDLRSIACEKCPSIFCRKKGQPRIKPGKTCTVE